jgi:hypothetical protein
MGGFLRALQRVGLVEIEDGSSISAPEPGSDAAIEHILADDAVVTAAAAEPGGLQTPHASAAIGAPTTASAHETGFVEGAALAELYAAARVPPSPYTAEKLLRVLSGLSAMEPGTRKAAVLALDAADEDWTVADAVLDAQRKARALHDAQGALSERLGQQQQQAEHELAAQDSYRDKATESIRQQIAELERMLQQELEKVAQERASVQARLEATRQSCAREAARYGHEIVRLEELVKIFGQEPAGKRHRSDGTHGG